ncbi:MAG TPA: YfhO family protein [Ruminiclostridium sp.]|nr:YfhO family protein [Ruminiclostridium sp.]
MRIGAIFDKPVRLGEMKSPYLKVFFIAFFTALSFLLPYIILDKGLFLFYGDYCVQQVPFYSLAHDAIRSGNIWWNWNTDLGANFVGSYAFYLLGSPFFWLTMPLPSAAVPYTLGPLLAFKMAVAALTSYAFIARFVKNKNIAVIGGLLYAFSSYSIYDIFFNHFHEPMAFFPLMLIALEEFMLNNRKGFFAVAVFLNALVNYNFFVGGVVFVVIYWIIRMLSGEWQISPKKYLALLFEAVIGFSMSCFLVLPAVLAITGNPRTSSLLKGWDMLVYEWPQRYLDIIHSVFFPQDLPSAPNFFPDSNAKWSSVAAWLPMFSMTGVIGYLISKRKSWLRRIIVLCFVFALVPVLNASFVLFNEAYYGRWFYMGVLMLALATAIAFDDPEIDIRSGFRWTVFITAAFTVAIGLIPKYVEGSFVQVGLEEDPARFWSFIAVVGLGLVFLWVIFHTYKQGTDLFASYGTIALVVIVCLYGNLFIATGKSYGWDGNWFKTTAVEGSSHIKVDETQFSRIDVLNGIDNQGMFWHLPTINAFQSVVPASIMNFYNTIGVTRDVGSRPETSVAGVRPLLSVKYLFDQNNFSSVSMPGWKQVGSQLGFKQWENTNFIPMGFTYKKCMSKQQLELSQNKDRVLLKAIVLDKNQIARYKNILTAYNQNTDNDFSDSAMAADCAARRTYTCSSFKYDNKGFSASIDLPSKNLVFFSVPYDSGWKATVNGKPAKIEEVNIGFMAVLCDSGTSNIRFSYTTPGLYPGIAISGISVLVFAAYLIYLKKRGSKQLIIENTAAGSDGDISKKI